MCDGSLLICTSLNMNLNWLSAVATESYASARPAARFLRGRPEKNEAVR